MKTFKISRYHDISCGHRVVGHEHKCRFLHGHNYRIHFHCRSDSLDHIGRVVDFSVVRTKLCDWLEDNWDHRMLVWQEDPLLSQLQALDESVITLPFNPTAENLAKYLVEIVGPKQLGDTSVELYRVDVGETRKCSASYSI